VRVFKIRFFARHARKAAIDDAALLEVVDRVSRGLADAAIGKFLIKQRIARQGEGRSTGLRAVLFFRQGDKAVFLHLFAKSRKADLTEAEESGYRDFAKQIAQLSDGLVARLVEDGEWIEVRG
jgi:hypothetical protein